MSRGVVLGHTLRWRFSKTARGWTAIGRPGVTVRAEMRETRRGRHLTLCYALRRPGKRTRDFLSEQEAMLAAEGVRYTHISTVTRRKTRRRRRAAR